MANSVSEVQGAETLHCKPVRLNVGGVRYLASRSTLASRRDSFFSGLLSGKYGDCKDESGAFFIDRSGKHFEHILDFLRGGVCNVPDDPHVVQAVIAEAQFYSLMELAEHLGKRLQASEDANEQELLRFDGCYIYHPEHCCSGQHVCVTVNKGGKSSGSSGSSGRGSGAKEECEKVVINFTRGKNFKMTQGSFAEEDMTVLRSITHMPALLREGSSDEVALFVARCLVRGTYRHDDENALLLRFTHAEPPVPGVLVGGDLYLPTRFSGLESERWNFRKFTFRHVPKNGSNAALPCAIADVEPSPPADHEVQSQEDPDPLL